MDPELLPKTKDANGLEVSSVSDDLRYELAPSIIATGLARLDSITQSKHEPPTPEVFQVWSEVLKDIPREKLIGYFRRLEAGFVPTSACPFPMPAHILQMVAEEKAVADGAAAEKAWQKTLKTILDFFQPTIGWKRWAPKRPLDKKCERAAAAAGGLDAIYFATDDKLIWIKKDFLKAYAADPGDSPEDAPVHPEVLKQFPQLGGK